MTHKAKRLFFMAFQHIMPLRLVSVFWLFFS